MKMKRLIPLVALFIVLTFGSYAAHALTTDILQGAQNETKGIGAAGYGEGTSQEGALLTGRIAAYISVALGFVGIVLVLFIFYAGYLWFTADGDDAQVKKARAYMTNAIIGAILVLSAYVITDYVFSKIVLTSVAEPSVRNQECMVLQCP